MELEGLNISPELLDTVVEQYRVEITDKVLDLIAMGQLKKEQPVDTSNWVIGRFIRMLPEHCQILVDPSEAYCPPPAFCDLPTWEVVLGPYVAVGTMARNFQPVFTHKRSPSHEQDLDKIILAGEEVYLRPQTVRPYFNFVVDEFTLGMKDWQRKVITLDPEYDSEKYLTEVALEMLEERENLFKTQLAEFSGLMLQWRGDRRWYELVFLENELLKDHSNCLPPGFSADNLVDARRHIEIETAKDYAGLISPWEVGLRERELGEGYSQPYDAAQREMAAIAAAIVDIKNMLRTM
ncbi:hypothetical protein N7466_007343 [Penicillium verhagenii]|uniref:uncharacterized protein n=1 Tax=Penicillium verhagenii TaxID=1562060 RepID=UPI0025453C73|nr:uncharacterized protein N7466_007343 [Penicillium verhagenii]KAJ5928387.1 hypothetical protein N7466_007343 [Penicillium verhagenii]